MASSWSVTVNGEKFDVAEADVAGLRAALADAAPTGGWVEVHPSTSLVESVEVLMTPATQVTLRLTAPSPPPMMVGLR